MDTLGTTTLLVRVADQRDDHAWKQLFRCYAPLVSRYCERYGLQEQDVDDIVQETMIGVIQAIRDQRFQREKGSFKAYLRGLAHNKVQDHLKRHYRAPRQFRESSTGTGQMLRVLGREPDPCGAFEEEWQKNTLQICLDAVRAAVEPVTYQAFDLYAVKGWAPEKVAEFLGITRNAVYIAKARVLSHVRLSYEEMESW